MNVLKGIDEIYVILTYYESFFECDQQINHDIHQYKHFQILSIGHRMMSRLMLIH